MDQDFHKFRPILSSMLGLSYKTYVNQMKQHFGIGLAYENMYVYSATNYASVTAGQAGFSQNNFDRESFDLGLHGVTLNLDWGF